MASGAAIEVIVVEDDRELREEVVTYLVDGGFGARAAGSSAELEELLREKPADVVVLDLGLPDEDGIAIAARLRKGGDRMGLIIMTARTRTHERVLGYDIGADMYLMKPVDYAELKAAIRALSRRMSAERAGAVDTADHRAAEHGRPWLIDADGRTLATPDGMLVRLTRTEAELMSVLADAAGRPMARAAIAERMGRPDPEGEHRHVDAMISRLRRKVTAELGRELPLQAAHLKGYLFAAPLRRARDGMSA